MIILTILGCVDCQISPPNINIHPTCPKIQFCMALFEPYCSNDAGSDLPDCPERHICCPSTFFNRSCCQKFIVKETTTEAITIGTNVGSSVRNESDISELGTTDSSISNISSEVTIVTESISEESNFEIGTFIENVTEPSFVNTSSENTSILENEDISRSTVEVLTVTLKNNTEDETLPELERTDRIPTVTHDETLLMNGPLSDGNENDVRPTVRTTDSNFTNISSEIAITVTGGFFDQIKNEINSLIENATKPSFVNTSSEDSLILETEDISRSTVEILAVTPKDVVDETLPMNMTSVKDVLVDSEIVNTPPNKTSELIQLLSEEESEKDSDLDQKMDDGTETKANSSVLDNGDRKDPATMSWSQRLYNQVLHTVNKVPGVVNDLKHYTLVNKSVSSIVPVLEKMNVSSHLTNLQNRFEYIAGVSSVNVTHGASNDSLGPMVGTGNISDDNSTVNSEAGKEESLHNVSEAPNIVDIGRKNELNIELQLMPSTAPSPHTEIVEVAHKPMFPKLTNRRFRGPTATDKTFEFHFDDKLESNLTKVVSNGTFSFMEIMHRILLSMGNMTNHDL